MTKTLIENLQNSNIFDHPIDSWTVIETHISWVLLTGSWAYKIKKPLDLGFLDFTSLAKRHFFCQEEIRLNKILAPDIYADVVAITGSHENPSFNGDGETIEYAVRMREFPQSCLFSELLPKNRLTLELIEKVAHTLAEFHMKAAIDIADRPYGTHSQIHEPVLQNFDQIFPFLTQMDDLTLLNEIAAWADKQSVKHQTIFELRKPQGFIRECHGDVHLGNIALIDDTPVLFDCIEFNESFRWTDTMADLGFLAMDLEDKDQKLAANRLINSYMQYTGDYQALAILDYYKSYRAVVRAKIALFSADQADANGKLKYWQHYRHCMALAKQYMQPRRAALVIMHGLPASGKSTLATQIADHLGLIHISSDIERKRLANVNLNAQHYFGLYQGLYHPDTTANTYQHLASLAQLILSAGYPVLIDASFILKKYRQQLMALAQEYNLPFLIIHTDADVDVLRERIHTREQQEKRISEAYPEVLERLLNDNEPLSDTERQYCLTFNMESPPDIQEILPIIEERLSRPSRSQHHSELVADMV